MHQYEEAMEQCTEERLLHTEERPKDNVHAHRYGEEMEHCTGETLGQLALTLVWRRDGTLH